MISHRNDRKGSDFLKKNDIKRAPKNFYINQKSVEAKMRRYEEGGGGRKRDK